MSDSCDVCGEIQTIEHLLWNCRYVGSLWKIVENVLDTKLNFDMILGINNSCKTHCVDTCFIPCLQRVANVVT